MYSIPDDEANEDYHDNEQIELTPGTRLEPNPTPSPRSIPQKSDRPTSSALLDYSNTARSSNPHQGPPNPLAYEDNFHPNEQNTIPDSWDTVQYQNADRRLDPAQNKPVPSVDGIFSTSPVPARGSTHVTSSIQFVDAPAPRNSLYEKLLCVLLDPDAPATSNKQSRSPRASQYEVCSSEGKPVGSSMNEVPADHDGNEVSSDFMDQNPSPDTEPEIGPALLPDSSNTISNTTEPPISATPSDVLATLASPSTSNTSTDTSRKVCSNCSTTDAHRWHFAHSPTEILCDTCYKYQHKHNKPRPPMPRPTSDFPKICTNCSTTESRKWYLDVSKTGLLCSACYHYKWKYDTDRPISNRPKMAEIEKICLHCSTTEASRWVTAPSGTEVLCRPCFAYQKKHQTARPLNQFQPISEMEKMCSNCSRTSSCKWYHNIPKTGVLCSNCYIYEWKHDTDRPLVKPPKMADMEKICVECLKTESYKWYLNRMRTGLVCSTCYTRHRKRQGSSAGIEE